MPSLLCEGTVCDHVKDTLKWSMDSWNTRIVQNAGWWWYKMTRNSSLLVTSATIGTTSNCMFCLATNGTLIRESQRLFATSRNEASIEYHKKAFLFKAKAVLEYSRVNKLTTHSSTATMCGESFEKLQHKCSQSLATTQRKLQVTPSSPKEVVHIQLRAISRCSHIMRHATPKQLQAHSVKNKRHLCPASKPHVLKQC